MNETTTTPNLLGSISGLLAGQNALQVQTDVTVDSSVYKTIALILLGVLIVAVIIILIDKA